MQLQSNKLVQSWRAMGITIKWNNRPFSNIIPTLPSEPQYSAMANQRSTSHSAPHSSMANQRSTLNSAPKSETSEHSQSKKTAKKSNKNETGCKCTTGNCTACNCSKERRGCNNNCSCKTNKCKNVYNRV